MCGRHPRSSNHCDPTLVVAVPLDEASAKVRTGPPHDAEEDMALDVWAGVVPIRLVRDEPVPASAEAGP